MCYTSNGYRIWDTGYRKIFISTDVVSDEKIRMAWQLAIDMESDAERDPASSNSSED